MHHLTRRTNNLDIHIFILCQAEDDVKKIEGGIWVYGRVAYARINRFRIGRKKQLDVVQVERTTCAIGMYYLEGDPDLIISLSCQCRQIYKLPCKIRARTN